MAHTHKDDLAYKRCQTTLSGLPILVDDDWNESLFRVDYPMRRQLGRISRYLWDMLLKTPRNPDSLIEAASMLFREYDEEMLVWRTDDDDVVDSPASASNGRSVPATTTWVWELENYTLFLEYSSDDYPAEIARGVPDLTLTWSDLYSLFGLRHVEETVRLLDAGRVCEAGACAIEATQAGRIAAMCYAADEGFNDASRALARRGADEAHRENRRLRAAAIELYRSREWPSKAAAAREISKKVNRVELVVLRWIRMDERTPHIATGTAPAQ